MIAHWGQMVLLRARDLEVMAEVAIVHQLMVLLSRSDAVNCHRRIELGWVHSTGRDKLWRIVAPVILEDVVG